MMSLFRKIFLFVVASILLLIAGNSVSFGQQIIPAAGVGNKTSIGKFNGIVEGAIAVKTGTDTGDVRRLYAMFGRGIDSGVIVMQNGYLLYYNGSAWIAPSQSSGVTLPQLTDSLQSYLRKSDSTANYVTPTQLNDSLANHSGSSSDFLNASYTATHGDQEQDFDYTAQIWNRLRAWSVNDTNQLPIFYYGNDNSKSYAPVSVIRSNDGFFYQTTFAAPNNDSSLSSPYYSLQYYNDGTQIQKQSFNEITPNDYVSFVWDNTAGIVDENDLSFTLGNINVFYADSILDKTKISNSTSDFTITPNTFTFNGGDIYSGNGLVHLFSNETDPEFSLFHHAGVYSDGSMDMGVYDAGNGITGSYMQLIAKDSSGLGDIWVIDAANIFLIESRFGGQLQTTWDANNFYYGTAASSIATNLIFTTNSMPAITLGAATQYVSLNATPTYADDAAAAADTTLPSGGLYLITGATGLHQKP